MTRSKVLRKTEIGKWYSITIRGCTRQFLIKSRGNLGMNVEYLDDTKVIASMKSDWVSYHSIESIQFAECPIQA